MFIVIPEDHVFMASMQKHTNGSEALAAAEAKAQAEQGRPFAVLEVVARATTDKPAPATLTVRVTRKGA